METIYAYGRLPHHIEGPRSASPNGTHDLASPDGLEVVARPVDRASNRRHPVSIYAGHLCIMTNGLADVEDLE
ncbi:MAG: hypothetical protein IRY97_12270 [Thermomicrobiaceae bacterium]|nr:hypothetical protein [Thermomicrobiaceae bacterium]